MLVVSLGGSPSQRSRSGVLLERSQRWLQEQGVEVVSYQVRDFPAEDLLHARFDSPKVLDLLAHTLTNRLLHPPTAALREAALRGDTELTRAAERLF